MIEHLMLRLGRMLTEDTDLRVTVRGSSAYWKPGEIVLPSVEHFSDLPLEGAERMLHGLVDHEVGHAVDSDHGVFEQLQPGSALQVVTNAIEDGVIERRRGLVYPGSRYNLGAKNSYFWQDLRQRLEAGSNTFIWRLVAAYTLLLRADGAPSLREVLQVREDLGAALTAALEATGDLDALARTPGKPTGESVARARAVLARLGIDPEQRLLPEEHVAPVTPEAALVGVIGSRLDDEGDDGAPYVVYDPSFDLELPAPAPDAGSYAALVASAEPVICLLSEVFESRLYARAEVRRLPGVDADDERAEADVSQLGAFALGAVGPDEIWLGRTGGLEALGRPAVALLIDCSGSMAGQKAAVARGCAVACHEALSRLHVPHEINGFTTAISGMRHPWIDRERLAQHFEDLRVVLKAGADRGEKLSRYARTCRSDNPVGAALQVPTYAMFKGFDDLDAPSLHGIDGIANNLDGEAVTWQSRRLAQRPEPRKVLIVFSDGLPNGSNRRQQGERYLAEAVRRATASGIEVYGIGIETDYVSHYYPHWRVCRRLADLPEAMADVLLEAFGEDR